MPGAIVVSIGRAGRYSRLPAAEVNTVDCSGAQPESACAMARLQLTFSLFQEMWHTCVEFPPMLFRNL